MLSPLSVVTGATGGLGLATAAGLARAGRQVVLTGRNLAKGEAALARLRAELPRADLRFAVLDLASLRSIRRFAEALDGRVDVLVNNAGVMAPPVRQATEDGFELQFGTNYLGHFALTARLQPALLPGARVVSVSSLAHRRGAMHFDDLQAERAYRPWRAYGQSKLAMLVFARELQRRAGAALESIAAHPGWAVTDIIHNGPGQGRPGLREHAMQAVFRLFGQSAAEGAQPILFAALSPDATPGGYYGPARWGEISGPPAPARVFPQATDPDAAQRLWAASEQLTGTILAFTESRP